MSDFKKNDRFSALNPKGSAFPLDSRTYLTSINDLEKILEKVTDAGDDLSGSVYYSGLEVTLCHEGDQSFVHGTITHDPQSYNGNFIPHTGTYWTISDDIGHVTTPPENHYFPHNEVNIVTSNKILVVDKDSDAISDIGVLNISKYSKNIKIIDFRKNRIEPSDYASGTSGKYKTPIIEIVLDSVPTEREPIIILVDVQRSGNSVFLETPKINIRIAEGTVTGMEYAFINLNNLKIYFNSLTCVPDKLYHQVALEGTWGSRDIRDFMYNETKNLIAVSDFSNFTYTENSVIYTDYDSNLHVDVI